MFLDYIEDQDKSDWLIQNVVHDSCVLQLPIRDLEEALETSERLFTTATMDHMKDIWGVDFNCPIEVDFEIGATWGNLHKWDYTPQNLGEIVDKIAA